MTGPMFWLGSKRRPCPVTKNRFSPVLRFDDPGDSHSGYIIRTPDIRPDPFRPGQQVMVFYLSHPGAQPPDELWARGRMASAIHAAARAVGDENLEQGGYLTVTFTGYRGRTKLYHAVYELVDADGWEVVAAGDAYDSTA